MCVRLRWVLCLAVLLVALPIGVLAESLSYDVVKSPLGEVIGLKSTSAVRASGTPSISKAQAEITAREFLLSQNLLSIPKGVELNSLPVVQDRIGHSRVRMTQSYRGVPVYGAEVIVNLDAEGNILFASSSLSSNLLIRVRPKFNSARANRIALRAAEQAAPVGKKLIIAENTLIILPAKYLERFSSADAKLAYEVRVDSSDEFFSRSYFIDAVSGNILTSASKIQHLNREVYDCSKSPDETSCYIDSPGISPYLHGRSEFEPLRGPHNNPAVPQYQSIDVDYMHTMGFLVHDWVQTSFGINGANNLGGTRDAAGQQHITRYFVHAEGPSGSGVSFCPGGAFTGTTYSMVFCHSEIIEDWLGHEYGHALSAWSYSDGLGTPGIDPLNVETKALSEAHSDIMGESFEFDMLGTVDWIDGTGSVVPATRRNLANPHSSNYFPTGDPYAQRLYDPFFNCDDSPSTGGYYVNSTVYSHAMYLAAEGGDYNGCTIEGQGIEFVKQVFFRAFRTYFDRSQNFDGAYSGIMQACNDLYSTSECGELNKALQAVEVNQAEAPFGGGKCVDPNGINGEQAPGCAVQDGGTPVSCRPDATVTDLFAPTENIWTDLSGATPYETVDLYYVPNDPDRPKWQDLSTVALDSRTDVPIDGGGIAATDVTVASTPGTYDIVIDGNQDGMYQPWADSVTTLNVQVPVDGDALCYAGESYATSENCHDSPSDCGCDPGYFCKGVYNQGAPEYSCARIRIGHGCFLSGTQITMADGATKPIESIDVGDEVRSLDPDTGEFIVGQVRSLSQANVGEYLLLNGKTKVTSVHRFYVPRHAAGIAKTRLGAESGQLDLANGEWIEIGKLPIGTMLLNSDGELVELKSLEPITASDTPVYNFEVYPQPNYIADGIVVHNRKPERIIAWEGDGGGGYVQ